MLQNGAGKKIRIIYKSNNQLEKTQTRCFSLCPPGSQPRHCRPDRSVHVASPLVHVGGHFCHPAPHRAVPHPVRVEQPLRNDTPREEQAARVLLLLRPQSLLRHTVWTHCRHQGKVIDVTGGARVIVCVCEVGKMRDGREE